MKDRNTICEYYEFEGGCSKGRKGTFLQSCQTCQLYKKKQGYAPAGRKNLKRQKIERERRKDFDDMKNNYK